MSFTLVYAEKCRNCDLSCDGVDDDSCYSNWCTALSSSVIGTFSIIGFFFFWRIVLLYKHAPSKWTRSPVFERAFRLKTLVFAACCSFCFLRVLRYSLLFVNIQTYGAGWYAFDQLLNWWSLTCLTVMYTSILASWVQLCEGDNLLSPWLEGKSKYFLVGMNIFSFLNTTNAGLSFLWMDRSYAPLLNLVILPGMVFITTLFIREGYKVYKLLGGVSSIKLRDERKRIKLHSTTIFTILTSGGAILLITFIILVSLLRRSVLTGHFGCLFVHSCYRIAELISICFIAYHFYSSGLSSPNLSSNKSDDTTIQLNSSTIEKKPLEFDSSQTL